MNFGEKACNPFHFRNCHCKFTAVRHTQLKLLYHTWLLQDCKGSNNPLTRQTETFAIVFCFEHWNKISSPEACISILTEVENAATQFMKSLKFHDLVHQTDTLLEHYKHVVEHNGTYIDCEKLIDKYNCSFD